MAIAWISLVASVLSGAAWLIVLSADIGRRPVSEVFSDDIVWSVLTRTRFGTDWSARLAMALLLAGGLLMLSRRRDAAPQWLKAALATLAASILGSLAWAGHAAGTPGLAGDGHMVVDVLHLVAAGAWIGGLVPLALLFAAARGATDPAVAAAARATTLRFSTLGVIAVGTILVTGLVNTYLLVGSLQALVATDYGRLLLVKIGVFAVIFCIAALNRLRMTRRLSEDRTAGRARQQLRRNSLIEAALGLLILVIVGALGTLPPGMHALPSAHRHGM